jgi:uncharacterized C2H2 Zn-finger protein
VRAKYADTSAIVTRLLGLGPRVRVQHGVDALAIHDTLASTAATATAAAATSEEEDPGGRSRFVFDHIVFNHPHTGWEDMHRHAALLAHFLESSKAVLEPQGGQVHVTLAGEQPVRWRLLETARRLGFHLRHVCDFYRQFGPNPLPSEIKRHQSGKSFRLRGLPSFTFTFSLAPDAASPILWRHTYEDHAAVLLQPGSGSGSSSGSGSGSAVPKGAITEVARTFKCRECEKRFRGPKDLRKHEQAAHEMRELEVRVCVRWRVRIATAVRLAISHRSSNAACRRIPDAFPQMHAPTHAYTQDAAPAELVCTPCGGRVFKDRTALDQHTRAKHVGQFQDLKPDWSLALAQQQEGQQATGAKAPPPSVGDGAPQHQQLLLRFKGKDAEAYAALLQSDPGASAVYQLCEVCGYHVPTDVDHLADLRPPERPTFRCLGCERTFHEERALKQHANACQPFLAQLRRQHEQQQQEEEQQQPEQPQQQVVES